MSQTKIEWTQATWNPIIGCTKCSPGCLNCYAERMARRQVAMGRARHEAGSTNDEAWAAYSSVIDPGTGKWNGDVCYRQVPVPNAEMIFPCSMSDLFHVQAGARGYTQAVFETMMRPQYIGRTFQVLTKRADRMLTYAQKHGWPLNVWPGTTVCNQQEADEKIPILVQIPAAVRFVSLEPLLEGIQLLGKDIGGTLWIGGQRGCDGTHRHRHKHEDGSGGCRPHHHHDNRCKPGLDWVIVGPETGPGARPCKLEWIDGIVSQSEAADVPRFVKAAPYKGKVTKDINIISSLLGRRPEKLQEVPRERSGQ